MQNKLNTPRASGYTPKLAKVLAVIGLSAFILSIVPLLSLSRYNRPYADDYAYGLKAVQAWRASGSLFSVVSAALREAYDSFYTWQGTFAAVFMFSIQPGIFGEQLYFLSTFFLLGSLIAATFYFLYRTMVTVMKADIWAWLIASCAISYLTIHHMPAPDEGYYWYNGGVYYTFFYSLYLVQMGSLMNISSAAPKHRLLLKTAGISLLSIFIGGGNYITGLISVLSLGLLSIAYLAVKKKNGWIAWLALLFTGAALLISALAPGNGLRAAALVDQGIPKMPLLAAIKYSFIDARYHLQAWASPQVIGIVLFLLPLMIKVIRGLTFSFKYPLIVLIGFFCMFAAQFSPPILMNVSGSGRFLNIYYYFYILMVIACTFYCLGWLMRVLDKLLGKEKMNSLFKNRLFTRIVCTACVLVLIAICADACINGFAGKTALEDIRNGRAGQFAMERDARLAVYMDPAVTDALVSPLTARPRLFTPVDLKNSSYWINEGVARFYNKSSVSIQ